MQESQPCTTCCVTPGVRKALCQSPPPAQTALCIGALMHFLDGVTEHR